MIRSVQTPASTRRHPPFVERMGSGVRRLAIDTWRWGSIGAGAGLVVVLLLLRNPLAEWLWPETRAQQLRERAELALRQGRLSAPDGSGARELYQAALALDPDRSDARDGLNRVGEAALAQARDAIARRDFERAHQALALATELSAPRTQVQPVREHLRRNEAASVGIEDLLQQAAAARTAGRLDGGDDSALLLYQRVIDLQPARIEALEGREDTLSDLLQRARTHLQAGDLADAAAIIRRVRAADAGHVELPDALADLGRAAEQRRRQADRHLRRGRLGDALAGYRAALAVDADDVEAQRGITDVAAAHARRSERFAADYRFAEARAELRQAQAIAAGADLPAITEAQQHLARAQQAQRQTRSTLSPAQRQRQVSRLLVEVSDAEARGALVAPPGESAFDKLRAARAIAPQDPRVRSATDRVIRAAASCFGASLDGNRLVRAGACLDARRALEGDTPAVRQGRRELAQRWIAMGDQRLGAGEIQGAQSALSVAQSLDPAAEGLQSFADRVRTASAASGIPVRPN